MELSMIGVLGPVTERNFNTTGGSLKGGGPEWVQLGTILSRMTAPVKPLDQLLEFEGLSDPDRLFNGKHRY